MRNGFRRVACILHVLGGVLEILSVVLLLPLVVVPTGAKIAGKSIVEITGEKGFPVQCVFAAVYNPDKEEFSIPRGSRVISEGDELFLISRAEHIKGVVDFITRTG